MYSFKYKGLDIVCIQTFGREFDVIINDKLVLTEFQILPYVKNIDFENKIVKLLNL